MKPIRSILVVEDSRTINAVIARELSRQGFDTHKAHTLTDALDILSKEAIDLIILDLHLPDAEGAELIAHIQNASRAKIVVLTASKNEELREELFQYGIVDYIVKDTNLLYSVAEIVNVISQIVSRSNEHVLVIDDSSFMRKQIRLMLEPRNYRVSLAHTAAEGLKLLESETIDLLVLDMELPDMHGEKVLEIIRKDVRHLTLPIIVLSGTATAEIVRYILKNGANDFLRKPFVNEEFLLKVDLWIDYFKQKRALKEKTRRLQFLNENLEQLVYEEVQKNREEDKMMFQQFRQAQMGEMISMIAHQWRQPLNAIGAAVSLINMRVRKGGLDRETAEEITGKITNHLKHLSTTIDDFRDFFRPQKKMRVTDFSTICAKALSLIDDSLRLKDIEISIREISSSDFLSFENELVQVVINLLKNAEDALTERQVDDPRIQITIEGTTLRVCDNAGGVPEEIADRIFDPYFSTKKEKNGTGLGLYMSRMIVEEHCHGSIRLENTETGACFIISLPAGEAQERS